MYFVAFKIFRILIILIIYDLECSSNDQCTEDERCDTITGTCGKKSIYIKLIEQLILICHFIDFIEFSTFKFQNV